MAAIIIKLIDEKFQAKALIHNIVTHEHIIISLDNFFFCILLIIVIAASKIKRPTPTLIPLNAFATIVISKKLSKTIEIKKITIKDDTTIPNVATSAPKKPAFISCKSSTVNSNRPRR